MKLLCTADLHLGRRSSRLPDELNSPLFSCAQSWLRVVDLALERRVDLVLLGGDLIDQDNRFFEAAGPLEKGLARLAQAGVQTFAVAGNHDYRSLRDFSAAGKGLGLTLLGRERGWESVLVKAGGEEILLHGWSFTKEHHHQSPLENWAGEAVPGAPSLGLVHSELAGTGSGYAPLTSDDLSRTGVKNWVVGHLHKPFLSPAGETPLVLIPGSPQALDPGETGVHGPWLLEIDQGHISRPVQVPLSTARYEEAAVDLEGVSQEDELKSRLLKAVRELGQKAEAESGHLKFLSCRLTLEGRTALHGRLEALSRELAESPDLGSGRVEIRVDKVTVRTRPVLDLESLAGSGGLAAHLAGLIMGLESGAPSPEQSRLLQEALEHISRIHGSGPYHSLDPDHPPGQDTARQMIIDQGLLLLEELLRQKD